MAEQTIGSEGQLAGIQARVDATWTGPSAVLVARTVLLILGQAMVAGLYVLAGNSTPWAAAAQWWSVFWTVADLGCLLLSVPVHSS